METNTFYESAVAPTSQDTTLDRRQTRWLVFAGNDLSEVFQRQFQGAQIGGFYFGHDVRGLSLTKHMLRRCEIAPLIVGYDFLNPDQLGGDTSKVKQFQEYNEVSRQMVVRYAYETLPGDEIESILSSMQGPFDIGVREVVSLRGESEPKPIREDGRIVGFTKTLAEQLQVEIFPQWSDYLRGKDDAGNKVEFFPTTIALRKYLEGRRGQVSPAAREVISVLLESNAQYERWAIERLSEKGNLVKSPVSAEGRVYSWSNTDFRRFDQTERNSEEFLMQKAEPVADQGITREELAEMFKAVIGAKEVKAEEVEKPADLASGTRVSVEDKTGTLGDKKGGGYYAVTFDDGTEGNFRPTQFTIL